MREREIQTAILERLQHLPQIGWFARQNTGGATYEHKGRRRFVPFGTPGAADITGQAADGCRVELEIKTPKGRLSDLQKAFGLKVQRYNGIYRVLRSVDDLGVLIDEINNRLQ